MGRLRDLACARVQCSACRPLRMSDDRSSHRAVPIKADWLSLDLHRGSPRLRRATTLIRILVNNAGYGLSSILKDTVRLMVMLKEARRKNNLTLRQVDTSTGVSEHLFKSIGKWPCEKSL